MEGIVGYRHRSHGVGVKARPNHAASASVDLISLLLRDRLPRRAPVRQHVIQSNHLSLPWSPLPLRSPRSSCRARPRIQKVGGRRAPRSPLDPSSHGPPLPLLSLPRLDRRYASSIHRLSMVFCLGACLAPRERLHVSSCNPVKSISIQHAIAVGPVRSTGFTTLTNSPHVSHNSSSNSSILLAHTKMHRISSTSRLCSTNIFYRKDGNFSDTATFAASRASLYENGLDGTSPASSHVISFFCEGT